MKALRYCIICLVASMIFGTALADSKKVAGVNDTTITADDFKYRVGFLKPRDREKIDKEAFLDKLINEVLLVQEAEKLKLNEKEDYKMRMEAFSHEVLTDLYLQQLLKEKNTEEIQKKYYEENKNKKQYERSEMKRLSIIRVQTEAEAEEIMKKAQGGEDFEGLAMKYSRGPAAIKGGDFGFRTREGLRKEFTDVVFSMNKGDIKGPIKTEEGYHIIKVTDHREAGIAPFEEVRQMIAKETAKKLLDEKISELRKAATIQIDAAELKNLKIN